MTEVAKEPRYWMVCPKCDGRGQVLLAAHLKDTLKFLKETYQDATFNTKDAHAKYFEQGGMISLAAFYDRLYSLQQSCYLRAMQRPDAERDEPKNEWRVVGSPHEEVK